MNHTQPDPWSEQTLLARIQRNLLRLLDTTRDLFVQFIWGDLRDGMLDLEALPRPLRLLVRFGLVLAILLILLITQSNWIRATFALQPSLLLVPGRGLLVPTVLFPLGLFLFSLAWTFTLTGAVFSAWPIRLGLLALYILSVAGWVSSLPISAPGSAWLGYMLVTLTCLIVLTWHRARRRPLRLFALLLLTIGGLFAAIHGPMVAVDRSSGLSLGAANFENNLRALGVLAIPLLILLGLDIADFAQHAAEWTTQAVTSFLTGPWINLVAFAALAWLIQSAVVGWLDAPSVNRTLPSMLGISIFVLLLLGAWGTLALLGRKMLPITTSTLAAAAGRLATPLVLVYLGPPLIALISLDVALVVQIFAIEAEGWMQLGTQSEVLTAFIAVANSYYQGSFVFSTLVNYFLDIWLRVIMVIILFIVPFALHRKRIGVALMMATISIHYVWIDLTRPTGLLGQLTWDDTNFMALLWTLLLVGVAVTRAWQRNELQKIGPRVLLIVVILALLRDTSFIEDPFSPFFAFAGLGFLAFGLAWDLLTSGRWANQSTPRLPQTARIFTYLGYILITVTLVNWSVHSHDLEQLNRFTGDAALFGFILLGRPYLFLLLFGLATDIIQLESPMTDIPRSGAQRESVSNVSLPAETHRQT